MGPLMHEPSNDSGNHEFIIAIGIMQKLVEKQTNKIYFHLKTQKEMIQYEFILQFCNIVFFKKYHFKIQDKELFH